MRRVVALIFVLISIIIFYNLKQVAYAQVGDSSGVAVFIQINDRNVSEGDIVSLSGNGYTLGKEAYDPNIFGIVVKDPAVAFESSLPGSYPVVSQGKVLLRVSTINGTIKNGDLLTTSKMPGVGQKSTQTGFVVATALEDYTADSPDKVGKILVVLNVGLRNISTENSADSTSFSNLARIIEMIKDPSSLSPQMIIRMIVSSLMILISFAVGVGYFGRISSLGIEALGRNPLARRTIIFGIGINLVLAFGIISIGIAVSYFILVL